MFREQRWLKWFYLAIIISSMLSHRSVTWKMLKRPAWHIKAVFLFIWLLYRELLPSDNLTYLWRLCLWSVDAVWELGTCVDISRRLQNMTILSTRSSLMCIYWGQWRMFLVNVSTAAPEIKCFLWDIMYLYSGALQGFCGIGLCLKIQRILQWQDSKK